MRPAFPVDSLILPPRPYDARFMKATRANRSEPERLAAQPNARPNNQPQTTAIASNMSRQMATVIACITGGI